MVNPTEFMFTRRVDATTW